MAQRKKTGSVSRRVAENIKRLRESGGWSALECSEHVGTAESTWRSWENGNRSPDLDRLEDIANCLSVTVAELVS